MANMKPMPAHGHCQISAGSAKPVASPDPSRFDAVRYVELAKNVRDMHAGRLLADEQRFGDLAIRSTGGQLAQPVASLDLRLISARMSQALGRNTTLMAPD